MEFEFKWIEPSVVSVRTSGLASAADFDASYRQLVAEPEFGPGVKILADHTSLDVSALTLGEVEKIAAARERWMGSLRVRSALIVGISSPARYGLARMFEALAASQNQDPIGVFETAEEALAWLKASD